MDLGPFVRSIEKQNLNVEGVIVYREGGGGISHGETSHRWIPERRRTIYSVSKSFTSMAIGMAIDEGKLKLSDKVAGILQREEGSTGPESESRWHNLTLENLLTMNMGHENFSRPVNLKEALSYELSKTPGTSFFYDNTCTFLASAMLTAATGCKLRDYLLERLFRPLGISDPQWKESEDGYTSGATGLFLDTSEMALFGRFLLQRGNWEGKQLVPAAWIDGATRTQVSTNPQSKADYNLGYGYCFWTCRHGAYRCEGADGQFVVVLPAHGAVVTINSEEKNVEPVLWTVWDCILPQL